MIQLFTVQLLPTQTSATNVIKQNWLIVFSLDILLSWRNSSSVLEPGRDQEKGGRSWLATYEELIYYTPFSLLSG